MQRRRMCSILKCHARKRPHFLVPHSLMQFHLKPFVDTRFWPHPQCENWPWKIMYVFKECFLLLASNVRVILFILQHIFISNPSYYLVPADIFYHQWMHAVYTIQRFCLQSTRLFTPLLGFSLWGTYGPCAQQQIGLFFWLAKILWKSRMTDSLEPAIGFWRITVKQEVLVAEVLL